MRFDLIKSRLRHQRGTERVDCGWIPPDERDADQQALTKEVDDQAGLFADRGEYLEDLPSKALLYDLEIKAAGKILLRIYQQTGSCVGAGGNRAYSQAACGDIVHRGDIESVKIPWFMIAYGEGRRIGNMRGRGEGSFGGAQAKAIEQFGMLPIDDPRSPPYKIKNGWVSYNPRDEIKWSYSPQWPVSRDEIKSDAIQYSVESVVKVDSIEEAKQLLAQGYGITLASMYGTRPRVEGDVLIGPWNSSWAHQMSCGGYWEHPNHGLLFAIDNQWSDNGHGGKQCPTLSAMGVRGSFWAKEDTFARVIRNGEVYGHSTTKGFPKQIFDWGRMGYPT